MEYQYNEIPETPATGNVYNEVPVKNSNMATASMIMGIIGILLGCCCMGTVFGGLAILFACLSKTGSVFEPKAKAGLIMGIIAICITVIMFFVFIIGSADSGVYGSLSSIMASHARV